MACAHGAPTTDGVRELVEVEEEGKEEEEREEEVGVAEASAEE